MTEATRFTPAPDGAGADGLKDGDLLDVQHRVAKLTIVKRAKPAATPAARGKDPAEVDPDKVDPDNDEDGEGDIYEVSLSSEEPVDRWFGREILDHSPGAIDLSRAVDGLPLLSNHDSWDSVPIGRLSDVKTDGAKLNASARFFDTELARDWKAAVEGGHREMSIGYSIEAYEVTPGKADEPSEYRATRWTPLEGSLVSVPADASIGVGRDAKGRKAPVHVRHLSPHTPKSGTTEIVMTDQAAPDNGQASRGEAAEIILRAQKHGVPADKAAEWVRAGLTLAQVNEKILEIRATPPSRQPAAEQLELTEKEAREYSYCNAILAAADPKSGNSFEREISDELSKRMPIQYKPRGGVLIPLSMRGLKHEGVRKPVDSALVTRAMDYLARAGGSGSIDSATSNAIKEVVFTVYGGELIEFLRNQARVVEMGATVLTGLSSPIAFPRQTADSPAYWVAENSGSDVTSGNVTTDLVTLTPKTLQAATQYSRQLLVQASIDVEAMVRASIGYSHALAWDLAAIHGSGSANQPTGVYLASGVGVEDFTSTPTTGHQLQYPFLVDMENKVATANALRGTLGWLTNPGVAKSAKTKLEFPGVSGSRKIWEGSMLDGEMDGFPARATNQVSKTMTSPGLAATGGAYYGLIFGNWRDLLIGQFGGAMELIVDPYSFKKQGMIEVASFQMTDVEVRHGPSFCVSKALDATV